MVVEQQFGLGKHSILIIDIQYKSSLCLISNQHIPIKYSFYSGYQHDDGLVGRHFRGARAWFGDPLRSKLLRPAQSFGRKGTPPGRVEGHRPSRRYEKSKKTYKNICFFTFPQFKKQSQQIFVRHANFYT